MQAAPRPAHVHAEPGSVLGFPSDRPAAAYEAVISHVRASRDAWYALSEAAREVEALGFRANLLALGVSLAADAGTRAQEAGELAAQAGELQRQCATSARRLQAAIVATADAAADGAAPSCQARVSLASAVALAERLTTIVDETIAACARLRAHADCGTQAALGAGAHASRALRQLARAGADAAERLDRLERLGAAPTARASAANG